MEPFQRIWRRIDLRVQVVPAFRKLVWRLRGAKIGRGTHLPRALVTWPHQVQLGRDCILQPDIFFNYDHYWTPGPSIFIGDRVFIGRGVEFNVQGKVEVGNDALIASGVTFIDHDHGLAPGRPMGEQPSRIAPISVGEGAWIGANATILKGVEIGSGAVIGAGSVVTRSVPSQEIWGGVPARRIGTRVSTAKGPLPAGRENTEA